MVFSNIPQPRAHPVHLHGHAFHVVYIGYGIYNDDGTLREYSSDISCDNPCTSPMWANNTVPDGVMARVIAGRITPLAIQKDTVVVPPGGYVVIAFQADNPGYWFLHCHNQDHFIEGMAILLQEYTSAQHRAPPTGINKHGSFIWTIQDFNQFMQSASTCEDIVTPVSTPDVSEGTASVGSGSLESEDDISIPKAAFGIMLTIIALLAILCIILGIAFTIFCVQRKYSGSEKQSSTPLKDVGPSSTT